MHYKQRSKQKRVHSWNTVAFCVFLAACSGHGGTDSIDQYTSAARVCINRQAAEVAHTNVDLDTAAFAVIGRCNTELQAERRAFIERYPGYRDYLELRLRELTAARIDQARRAVAVARTRG